MANLYFSFSIIIGGLLVGYLIRNLVETGWLRLPVDLNRLRQYLQKAALLFVLPVTIVGAIWIANVQDPAIAALPLLGFGAITLGGMAALGAARYLHLPAYKTGAFFACGSFTNIGAIGALICYVFLGEPGFALVPIYKLLEEVTYYGIGFPIAKYFSQSDQTPKVAWNHRLRELLHDPFILVAVSSILLGGLLNFSDLPRPIFFHSINAVFIPLGTGMLLISIGLSMQFSKVRHYLKECLIISAIKFVLVPVVISSVAIWIGYGAVDGGIPLRVVIILTSMPVAFNALIPPSIYNLDLELANACWFFSTICLIGVLPVLLVVLRAV